MPIRNKQAAREAKQAQLPKLAGDKKRFLWKSFTWKLLFYPKNAFGQFSSFPSNLPKSPCRPLNRPAPVVVARHLPSGCKTNAPRAADAMIAGAWACELPAATPFECPNCRIHLERRQLLGTCRAQRHLKVEDFHRSSTSSKNNILKPIEDIVLLQKLSDTFGLVMYLSILNPYSKSFIAFIFAVWSLCLLSASRLLRE